MEIVIETEMEEHRKRRWRRRWEVRCRQKREGERERKGEGEVTGERETERERERFCCPLGGSCFPREPRLIQPSRNQLPAPSDGSPVSDTCRAPPSVHLSSFLPAWSWRRVSRTSRANVEGRQG